MAATLLAVLVALAVGHLAPDIATGVRVRAGTARYVASQPWPFPGALMLGFIADAEADEPVAGDELEQARWFGVDEVRAGLANDWSKADAEGEGIVLSPPISIARHVIGAWLAEHTR